MPFISYFYLCFKSLSIHVFRGTPNLSALTPPTVQASLPISLRRQDGLDSAFSAGFGDVDWAVEPEMKIGDKP